MIKIREMNFYEIFNDVRNTKLKNRSEGLSFPNLNFKTPVFFGFFTNFISKEKY